MFDTNRPMRDWLERRREPNDDGSIPHIHKNGIRFHTPSWTYVEPPGYPNCGYVEERCSARRCERNRDAILYEIGHLQALREHKPSLKNWCNRQIRRKEQELAERGIDRERSDARDLDPETLFKPDSDRIKEIKRIVKQATPDESDHTTVDDLSGEVVEVRRGE